MLSIFLYLSKSLNCVRYETQFRQLEIWCSWSGARIAFVLPQRREQCVCVQSANILTGKIKITCSVPQGSILGQSYFIKNNTTQNLETDSFIDLISCIQFFSQLNLRVNNSKSNVVIFSKKESPILSNGGLCAFRGNILHEISGDRGNLAV